MSVKESGKRRGDRTDEVSRCVVCSIYKKSGVQESIHKSDKEKAGTQVSRYIAKAYLALTMLSCHIICPPTKDSCESAKDSFIFVCLSLPKTLLSLYA